MCRHYIDMRPIISSHGERKRAVADNLDPVRPTGQGITFKRPVHSNDAITQNIDIIPSRDKAKDQPGWFGWCIRKETSPGNKRGNLHGRCAWTGHFSKDEPAQPEDNRQRHWCQPAQFSPLHARLPYRVMSWYTIKNRLDAKQQQGKK